MESSPSSSSVSTVIDFEGKRKLLTTMNNNSSEQHRPLDNKRKKIDETTNRFQMNDDVLQAIRQNFLTIQPRQTTPPSQIEQTRQIRSRIPIRSNSSSQSRSRSPKQRSTTSKIPVRISPSKKGAFQFVKSKEEENSSTDDDDDVETNNLKDEELKKKFQEEKRQRKQKGQLLNQLHENYNDLLEKYAQAENTIDQLRFQPKLSETNNTSTNNSSEIIQFSTIKYPSVNETPLSSIRPVASSSTMVTPVITMTQKDVSSGQSINREDETVIEEDLLNQSRTCGGKMKTFLTLMDANQLSLAEQKQAYETIRQDYQRLLQAYNERTNKNQNDNQRTDLNEELSNMKQLLKDIVKQMTEDLLEKSLNSSRSDRPTFPPPPPPPRPTSQISVRSSLCNQDELIDQYRKILTAVNTVPTNPLNERETNETHVDVSTSEASTTINDRTSPTPFSLGALEFETIGERSSDGMLRVMVKQDDLTIGETFQDELTKTSNRSDRNRNVDEEKKKSHFSSQRLDSEFISNVSSHSSSASSSESLTSPRLIIHTSRKKSSNDYRMLNNHRRYGNSPSTDEQLHRSTHTWRPEKTHRAYLRPVTTTRSRTSGMIYRSSLYIEPKRSNVVVASPRYTTISQQGYYPPCLRCNGLTTQHRQNPIDDPGYETESKSSRRRQHRRRRRVSSSSSDYTNDSDIENVYHREINLNEAFARAEQIEMESHRLATSVRRMLKMMMSMK